MSSTKRVDRLVVGHAGADGVGQRDVAGPIGPHQVGHAQHAVGPESLGVEEVVVEPAVDDVDPLGPAGRLQEDLIVVHEQVRPEDQLDAHVRGPGSCARNRRSCTARATAGPAGRVAGARGRDRAQGLAQRCGIILDAADAALLEQLGEDLLHHHPVFEHVADARRDSGHCLRAPGTRRWGRGSGRCRRRGRTACPAG